MAPKKKWRVYGVVTGSHYAGEHEAATKEEAMVLANNRVSVSFCHQCAGGCEDPEFEATDAEEESP